MIVYHFFFAVSIALCPILISSCGIANDPQDNSSIRYVADYDTPGLLHKVIVVGDYAYLADGDNGLLILNVASKFNPEYAGHHPTPGSAIDVVVSTDYYAYLIYQVGEMRHIHVIDVGAPENPVLVGNLDSITAINLQVNVSGQYAYVVVGNEFRTYEMTDPSRPVLRGSAAAFFGSGGLKLMDSYAFLTKYNSISGFSELVMVNIASPANPIVQPASALIADMVLDMAVAETFVYLACPDSGLKVADITSISSPVILGGYRSNGQGTAVFAIGGYVIYGDGNNGVTVLSSAQPNQLRMVGFYDTPGYVQGIYSDGQYIYVADGNRGLLILSINY